MGKMGEISEEKLCQDLRAWLEQHNWIVYPEVSDVDLVAVPGGAVTRELMGQPRWGGGGPPPVWDPQTDRVAIQAKLQPNSDVLVQALDSVGCTWRYVAVRRAGGSFLRLALELGFSVLVMEEHWRTGYAGAVGWRRPIDGWRVYPAERRHPIKTPLALPSIVTDLPAGTASPSPLTKWREAALLLCVKIREQGHITSADFKTVGVNVRRWLDIGWLRVDGTVPGQRRPLKRLIIGPSGLPDKGWEQIRDQLAAKSCKT